MLRNRLSNNQPYVSTSNSLNSIMSHCEYQRQDSEDDMSENTSPEVVDPMEGDSETADSITEDDGFSDDVASKSSMPRKKNKNGSDFST